MNIQHWVEKQARTQPDAHYIPRHLSSVSLAKWDCHGCASGENQNDIRSVSLLEKLAIF